MSWEGRRRESRVIVAVLVLRCRHVLVTEELIKLMNTRSFSPNPRPSHAQMNEARILPDDLKGNHKKRKDKMERLESVLAGRVGREEFGSSTGRKKGKTGGLTEREKQKKKAMPSAARDHQIQRNTSDRKAKAKLVKNFKGHVRGTGAHKAKGAH
jgi:hypothetical protein